MRNFLNIVSNLFEAKTMTVDLWYGKLPGGEIRIWISPTHSEILKLLEKFDLRGLVSPDKSYFWDAHLAVHSQIENFLNDQVLLKVVVTHEGGDFSSFDYWEGKGVEENGVSLMTEDGETGPHMQWSSIKRILGQKMVRPEGLEPPTNPL